MPRIFLALWPPADVARALAAVGERLAGACGGRPVRADRVHLTLAFLGDVAPERIDAVREAARGAWRGSIGLSIDREGSFRGAKVAWAAPGRTPGALAELQASLEEALRARHFQLERRAFAPHVTLVRRIRRPVATTGMEPIAWEADHFRLVETRPAGGGYGELVRWP